MVGGMAALGDGLVRVVSLGFLHTRLQVEWSRLQVKWHLNKLKKYRAQSS